MTYDWVQQTLETKCLWALTLLMSSSAHQNFDPESSITFKARVPEKREVCVGAEPKLDNFVFPSEKNRWCGDDDAFWAPYGESLNSFIAGHKKWKMKLFFVTDLTVSHSDSGRRSMALGHVVGRCDKTKMRRAFLSILHLLTCVMVRPIRRQVLPPLTNPIHCTL